MKKKSVFLLCLFSAALGAFFTLGVQKVFNPPDSKAPPPQSDPFYRFLTNEDPSLTNSPAKDAFDSQFFGNFFGDSFSQILGTEIRQRSDGEYVYFELPLKETEQSKLKTNLMSDYIEISGEITERKQSGPTGESVIQRSFSQTLPLPLEADPSTLQIISEPGKTVIRFNKRKK